MKCVCVCVFFLLYYLLKICFNAFEFMRPGAFARISQSVRTRITFSWVCNFYKLFMCPEWLKHALDTLCICFFSPPPRALILRRTTGANVWQALPTVAVSVSNARNGAQQMSSICCLITAKTGRTIRRWHHRADYGESARLSREAALSSSNAAALTHRRE